MTKSQTATTVKPQPLTPKAIDDLVTPWTDQVKRSKRTLDYAVAGVVQDVQKAHGVQLNATHAIRIAKHHLARHVGDAPNPRADNRILRAAAKETDEACRIALARKAVKP